MCAMLKCWECNFSMQLWNAPGDFQTLKFYLATIFFFIVNGHSTSGDSVMIAEQDFTSHTYQEIG